MEIKQFWEVDGNRFESLYEAEQYRKKADWYYSDPLIITDEDAEILDFKVPRQDVVKWLKKNGHKIPKEYLTGGAE